MIEKIISGISRTLFDIFGEDVEIYTEDVKQGFKEPCFIIELVDEKVTNGVAGRLIAKDLFSVTYYPVKDIANKDIQKTIGLLRGALRVISVGDDLVRTTNLSLDVADSELHITFDTTTHFIESTENIPMERVDKNIGIKED